MQSDSAELRLDFDQGTLLLNGFSLSSAQESFPEIPWVFDPRIRKLRADACWYSQFLRDAKACAQTVSDRVQAWRSIAMSQRHLPPLRPEQQRAMDAFLCGGERGVVVMPTGTGKTIVALAIARHLKVSCLFVAPIRDLMYQWHQRIADHLAVDAGIIGDNLFNVRPVSVTTYDSAAIHMAQLGNQFGLIVFDECHHLPGRFYRESALMAAAPHRLGLTATAERRDGLHHDLTYLIGPTLYELPLREIAGKSVADYRVHRIPVKLTEVEQRRYEGLSRKIQDYVYERRREDESFSWPQLVRESNDDAQARSVMQAFHQKQSIENRASEKLRVLEDLFRLHIGEPVLVFVGSNSMARDVSLRFLIPCLLSHCGKKERKRILDGFSDGIYPVIVANQILDEGIDLPEAKVAIVIGGSSSTRQAKQRLGRILRKSSRGEATMYEVVLDDTSEIKRSRARRRSDAFRPASPSQKRSQKP
jgi:superfamily II DNA or RNA helicase